MNYAAYINSAAWRQKREDYKASKLPWRCYCCGEGGRLDLHHKTYKRLGRERLTDLIPLCRLCHDAAHALVREWKASGANRSKRNLWTAARAHRKRVLRQRCA